MHMGNTNWTQWVIWKNVSEVWKGQRWIWVMGSGGVSVIKIHCSEGALHFRKSLTRGVNTDQQSHKTFPRNVPALVKVTPPGCPNNICLHLLASNVLVGIWFTAVLNFPAPLTNDPSTPTNEFKRYICLPNSKTPRFVPPCLVVFPL